METGIAVITVDNLIISCVTLKMGKKLNKKNWGRRETYRAADIASIVFTGCHGRVQVQRGQELLVQLLKWVRYDYIKWKIIESGVEGMATSGSMSGL